MANIGFSIMCFDVSHVTIRSKKVDKWVALCCSVVVNHAVVIDMLYLNSMINNCIRKTILKGDVVSYHSYLYK